MKLSPTTTLALLLGAFSSAAMPQVPTTREQVKAELREANRNGDTVEGESGMTRRAINPRAYPARLKLSGKTRAQVNAELREAVRSGDIAQGEGNTTRYERNSSAYPTRPVLAGKARNEVKAERSEAVGSGDIVAGESSLKLNEQFPGRYAKVRAQKGDTGARTAAHAPAIKVTP